MTRRFTVLLIVLLAAAVVNPLTSHAVREVKEKGQGAASDGDLEAKRLFDKAQDLFQSQENERAIKMLDSVIEQYPKSKTRFNACLVLGKHYLGVREQVKAISYLNQLRVLEQADKEMTADEKDMFLESTYMTGVAFFQARQYGAAFPILRRIVNQYPNTVWANQAYYYIGMCHFVQQNWSKTIEALSLVGTFVDPLSPTVQFIEAGRRFYVKVQDADLPVLLNLGKKVSVTAETAHGDKETFECIPLVADADVFIGSIPTEIGLVKPGDNTLQVIGGDTIIVTYSDENAQDGTANVVRKTTVKVVSTASATFTLGDGESKAAAAFLDQPLFVSVFDADLDTTDQADSLEVKLVSRYKVDEEELAAAAVEAGKDTQAIDLDQIMKEGDKHLKIRDQVTIRLTELGKTAPIHSGQFFGKVQVATFNPDKPVEANDLILSAAVDDEIVVMYVDNLHVGGEVAREVTALIPVIGEIDNQPKVSQDVVFDTVVKAKKNLVEGQAYLELARIFKSMGLMKGAKEKSTEGLDRIDFIIRSRTPIPSDIKQDAFRAKWELHIAADDLPSAIATCRLFNQIYPDSPFVDQALMGIAKIRMDNKEYAEAMNVFSQVLQLPKSEAKAEAQYRIAELTELKSKPGSEQAVQQYKICAERYPDSEYAGAALAKLVDYHVDMKDFAQANTLLGQIFQDYPDAKFLDSMLLKWVLVAYRSGDYQKASEKCSQLLFEYPESPFAEKAKQIMPKIDAQLKKGADKASDNKSSKE